MWAKLYEKVSSYFTLWIFIVHITFYSINGVTFSEETFVHEFFSYEASKCIFLT